MKDTGVKGWTSLKTTEPMAQLAAVIAAEANASGHGLSTEGFRGDSSKLDTGMQYL